MTETRLELQTGSTTTLDASGDGTISIGPVSQDETWEITGTHIHVSSNTSEPQCTTYYDFASTAKRIDHSYTGSDDTSDSRYTIRPGRKLVVVWSGGDSGATASVTVYGIKVLRGRRLY